MKQDWEYGILDDAVNKGSSNISINKIKGDDGDYPVYGAKGFVQNVSFYQQEFEYLGIIKDGAGIGRVSMHPNKSSILATMQYILPKEGFDIQFLKYFLSYVDFENYRTGSTIPHIYYKDYKKEPFPLVSLPEQKRIVATLEKAFTAIDQAKGNVEHNLQNADELFESLLFDSFQGKLSNPLSRENPEFQELDAKSDFNSLLNKIKVINRKPQREEKTIGHETITDVIPHEWQVTSISSIFRIIDYRGKTPVKSEQGKRLISAKNIRKRSLRETPIEYVSDEVYKTWMVRGFPLPNDIFFVTEGHTMGFAALNNRTDSFALAQRTITLQPAVPFSTQFFFYYIISRHFQELIKLNATGAAAVGIKASKFKSLPLPFPSFAEQNYIANILQSAGEYSSQVRSKYQKELTSLDELKKSILQKAFNGEL
jgi:type I restriction enzyme, S subunit